MQNFCRRAETLLIMTALMIGGFFSFIIEGQAKSALVFAPLSRSHDRHSSARRVARVADVLQHCARALICVAVLVPLHDDEVSGPCPLSFEPLFCHSPLQQARMSDYDIYKPSQIYTCGKIHESFESY
jgi:hypothetical protein